MPLKDKEARRAYMREWERKHLADPEYRKAHNKRKSLEHKVWRKANPDKAKVADRKFWLWKEYRVTPEWYDGKLAEQSRLCAICLQPEIGIHWRTGKVARLAVDHDHDSGAPRGLLCVKCNQNLHIAEMLESGAAKSGTWLEKALKYLQSCTGAA